MLSLPMSSSVSGLPLPEFLSPVLPWVALSIILGIIASLIRKAWPVLCRFVEVINEISKLGPALVDLKALKDDMSALKTDVTAVKKQVENDHKTNIRDDIDRTHDKVERIEELVDGMVVEIRANHQTNSDQWVAIARIQADEVRRQK